jgi:ABC-type cobalamin/Fe3+-siderophores transport system ATPase subunit
MNLSPLQIKSLSWGFKKPLSQGIDLTVNENEFVTIMGENGCGKTTLIDCLMGLHNPQTGEIAFWGNEYKGSKIGKINQKVGWVISQKVSPSPECRSVSIYSLTKL